jgi:hypothetical protein
MSALSTPIHEQLEQKKKKNRKTRSSTKKPKNQRKVKIRSFKMSKNLVPKDMGNGSTQPSKTKLALKMRQRAQHH